MDGIDFTDLQTLLLWLSGAGLAVWCVLVSDWFRNTDWAWWHRISPTWQQVVVYAVMGVPPLAAYLILQFVPADVIEAAAPHFRFVATLLSAMLVARGVFEITKFRRDYIEVVEVEVDPKPEPELRAVG